MSSNDWKDPSGIDLYTLLPVVVYGSLRTGLHNHDRFLADNPAVVSIAPAVLFGCQLHEHTSGLPIVIPRSAAEVACEIVTIANSRDGDALRDQLDQLESFRPYSRQPTALYDRVLAEPLTDDGRRIEGWLYVAGSAVIREDLSERSRVNGGDWLAR